MNKPVIGLTGPTGAGKSTVAGVLQDLGCSIVDADRIARSITRQPSCLNKLQEAFGADIIGKDGALDRQLLAKRAFSSPENTARLNAITHPAVIAESNRQIAAAAQTECRAVILDAPLLFESGGQALCDATIAVLLAPQSRLRRIMARDGITREQAQARMNAQNPDSYYEENADYIFDGGTDWSVLKDGVASLLNKILGGIHEKA